ncbi:FAD-dependent oxidoreductase [Actinoplanes sp. NPDC051411]|jgi:ferredoxin-NADP reductase|uniref:ferredoxin--NADP reductase n=1 Tax=Actinoplanes sp. NPDC051411 TaxID=3155522 RepID=UPI0034427984
MGMLIPIKARYVERRQEADDVTAFVFRPDRPFAYRAGQHGIFIVPGAGMKPLTIASAPEDRDLTIATRLGSGSPFKKALGALQPGDAIRVRGPLNRFTLSGSADDVVFIAQGVGITPFRSLLRHMRAAGIGRHSTLVHVGSAHAFRGETERLATRAWYPSGVEQFRFDLKRAIYERAGATCYVAGAPAFVADTAVLLAELGVAKKQLRRDSFPGY